VPLLINILAIFIWFIHWHGYWKLLNLKAFYISFIILSFFLCLQIKGLEFGAIYFFISTSLIGLLYLVESKHSFINIIHSRKYRFTRSHHDSDKTIRELKDTTEYRRSKLNSRHYISIILKAIINLLLMILVPFCAAASISLLLPTLFGIENVNLLVLSLFIFLISWSLFLTWVYMKEQRTMALCLLSLASMMTLCTVYISTVYITAINIDTASMPTIVVYETHNLIASTLPTNAFEN
jgi:cation transport ATPase